MLNKYFMESGPWFLLIAYGVTNKFNSSKTTPIHHTLLRTKIMQMKYVVMTIHLHKIVIISSTVLLITYAQKSKLKRWILHLLRILHSFYFLNYVSQFLLGPGTHMSSFVKIIQNCYILSRKTGKTDRHAYQYGPANFISIAWRKQESSKKIATA